MIIDISKFGTTLVSRPSGKEAWLAFQPILRDKSRSEKMTVDFNGVIVLTPSWADEFLRPLREYFNTVELVHIDNPSVKATLEILDRNT